MTFMTGSATDRYDLLDQLIERATADGISSVSIQSGVAVTGAYVVDDVLTVSGGTAVSACTLRVTSVSSGDITGVVVQEGGAYSTVPSNPVSVTGGGGTGATFNLTSASNGWTLERRSLEAASATVAAAGTGYNVADVLTLTTVGAVGITTSAQFTVATLTGGPGSGVATVTLLTAGKYEETPGTSGVATTVAPSGGTGCTLNVTYVAPTTQEQLAILRGDGGGSDAIYVGVKTYTAANGANTARNWAMYGFTAFNAGLTFDSQPGISPGDTTTLDSGAFVPLHDSGGSFPLDYWLSVTPNRIHLWVKVENAIVTHYASAYAGFVNRFGSATEWPYPIFICGSSSRYNSLFNSTLMTHVSSIGEMIGTSIDSGPGFYRRFDATWQAVQNSRVSSDETTPSRVSVSDRVAFPSGSANVGVIGVDSDDLITADPSGSGGFLLFEESVSTNYIIPTSGNPGAQDLTLHPTPNTGGALRRLYPLMIQFSESGPPTEEDVFGEIDGLFWVSASDVTNPLTPEDFILIGTQRYRVFPSGNRAAQEYAYYAMRED